ncbi:TAXI family TRAP transporter solute-binding subunit [Amorphus orientalis]|uniref:TRAP transporter TAXI family solute receptor n=1 Tax=Amorphus orientalis TaxID=649198 RepID=A0AAE4AT39_9HYPH|nr:TAXI family TRAP transporter solute-binding subunit [Amorphus orientalis]MDQ0316871.1 TRAP transporter TAXI family solute receptor [Amorphus orientalis]
MFKSILISSALVLTSIAAASAQTVGIGTTQGGATNQLATAIANEVSADGEIQMRPQIVANTSQYIPLVNAGQLEFGVANFPQTWYAVKGEGMSSEPNPNLRMVATLFPFVAGLVVTEESGIDSFADLKGKGVPRFPDDSLGEFVIRMGLQAGGLTYDDVTEVPVANFPRMYEALKQGQTAISISALGARPTYDLEASLGDIKFLSFTEENLPGMEQLMPGIFLYEVEASDDLPGIDEGATIFAYDYMLWANKDVDDAVVSSVFKSIYDNSDALIASSPIWSDFKRDEMCKNSDLEYHPGALAACKDLGLN